MPLLFYSHHTVACIWRQTLAKRQPMFPEEKNLICYLSTAVEIASCPYFSVDVNVDIDLFYRIIFNPTIQYVPYPKDHKHKVLKFYPIIVLTL